MKLVEAAEFLARKYHAGQKRDDGEDYINHPKRVVEFLEKHLVHSLEKGDAYYKSVILSVAWLHDVIEDSNVTLEELSKELFELSTEKGKTEKIKRIISSVDSLTNYFPPGFSGMNKENKYRLKTAVLVGKMFMMDNLERCVKLADRLDNLKGAKKSWEKERFEKYRNQTKEMMNVIDREEEENSYSSIFMIDKVYIDFSLFYYSTFNSDK